MNPSRRSFLASLGLAPLVARSYFDMGSAWAKHESGLYVAISAYDGATGVSSDYWLTAESVARLFKVPVHTLTSDPRYMTRRRMTPFR